MQEALDEMFRIRTSNETKEYAKMMLTYTGSIVFGYIVFFLLTLL
jgi:hypothetical protein